MNKKLKARYNFVYYREVTVNDTYYLKKYNMPEINYLLSSNKICVDDLIDLNSYWKKDWGSIAYYIRKTKYTQYAIEQLYRQEYNIKRITNEELTYRNKWIYDDRGFYKNEYKSWKRNSKRKHQWIGE